VASLLRDIRDSREVGNLGVARSLTYDRRNGVILPREGLVEGKKAAHSLNQPLELRGKGRVITAMLGPQVAIPFQTNAGAARVSSAWNWKP
jgi:hypothetical protein